MKRNWYIWFGLLVVAALILSACGSESEEEKILVDVPVALYQNADGSISWQFAVRPQGEVEMREVPQIVVQLNDVTVGYLSDSDEGVVFENYRYSHDVRIVGDMRNGIFNHKFEMHEVTAIFAILQDSNFSCGLYKPNEEEKGKNPMFVTIVCKLPKPE